MYEIKTPARNEFARYLQGQKLKALNAIKSDKIHLRIFYQSIKEAREVENIPAGVIVLIFPCSPFTSKMSASTANRSEFLS